jgi:hypothetical protein
MMQTTYFHLVPRLRMHGAVPSSSLMCLRGLPLRQEQGHLCTICVYNHRFQPWLISSLMHKILICLHIIRLLKSSTCFEHYPARLQEVYVVIVYMQPLVSSLSACDCLVHQLRKKFFLNRYTGQSPAESDDTRVCIDTVASPEDEQGNARNM